jgi:hypothetical protein
VSARRHAFGGSILIVAMLSGCASLLALDEPEFIAPASGDDANASPDAVIDGPSADGGSSSGNIDANQDAATKDAAADAVALDGILDTFDRPSSNAIGNGWIEKTPAVFDLLNNAAELVVSPTEPADAIVYRPAAEDVESVTVGVTLVGDKEIGAPMLLARLQSATAASPQAFTAYYATIPQGTPNVLQIVRRNGTSVTLLVQKNLPIPLSLKTAYRLSLKVVTLSPANVTCTAAVRELPSGALIGTISHADGLPDRIMTAGSVGFGATATGGSRTRFDDFTRTSP